MSKAYIFYIKICRPIRLLLCCPSDMYHFRTTSKYYNTENVHCLPSLTKMRFENDDVCMNNKRELECRSPSIFRSCPATEYPVKVFKNIPEGLGFGRHEAGLIYAADDDLPRMRGLTAGAQLPSEPNHTAHIIKEGWSNDVLGSPI